MYAANALELEKTFLRLQKESAEGGIKAHSLIPDVIYIASDQEGNFLCLINNPEGQSSPPVRLKFIAVDFGIRYKATVAGFEISGTYTVVKLAARNSHLLISFATLLDMLVSNLSSAPTQSDLRKLVELILELFTPKGGSPRERIKGLFGELSVINHSPNPADFTAAWHDNTLANKDFSLTHSFLEVKTTEGKVRQHHISSLQIESKIKDRRPLLASVVIDEDPRGQSVFELIDELKARLGATEQQKIIKIAFETLGLDVEEAHELKFILSSGGESILVFEGNDLPRPTISDEKSGSSAISQVSFTLNLEIAMAAGVRYKSMAEVEF